MRGGVALDAPDSRHICGLDSSAQRVGQQLSSERHQEILAMAEKQIAELRRTAKRRSIQEYPRRVDRHICLRQIAPPSDAVVVLERKAERIHLRMTRRADSVPAMV